LVAELAPPNPPGVWSPGRGVPAVWVAADASRGPGRGRLAPGREPSKEYKYTMLRLGRVSIATGNPFTSGDL